MEPEQGLDHSEVNPEELAKLTSLMDDEGSLGDMDEPEEESQETPKGEAAKPEAQPESKDQPETVEIEFNGQKHKVPAALKDGFLMQSDYTRKTQELAGHRSTVEQQRAQVQHLASLAMQFPQHFGALQQIDNQLRELQKVDFNALQAQDPLAALQARQTLTELTQARQNIQGQLQVSAAQMRQHETQNSAQAIEHGRSVLAKAIPDWDKPETRESLAKTAISIGLKPEEAASIMDPRMVMGLYELQSLRAKVAQYEAAEKAAAKQIRQAPRMVKPEASQDASTRSQKNDGLERLKRSGSDDDAVAALLHLMG